MWGFCVGSVANAMRYQLFRPTTLLHSISNIGLHEYKMINIRVSYHIESNLTAFTSVRLLNFPNLSTVSKWLHLMICERPRLQTRGTHSSLGL